MLLYWILKPKIWLLLLSNADINSSVMQLCELGIDLKQEDDATGFLGVMLECNPETNLLEM